MRAEVRIQANGKAKLLADALHPEMDNEVSRTLVEILADEDDLVINIQADDVVALRAALNSFLRWTKLAIDSENSLGVE